MTGWLPYEAVLSPILATAWLFVCFWLRVFRLSRTYLAFQTSVHEKEVAIVSYHIRITYLQALEDK